MKAILQVVRWLGGRATTVLPGALAVGLAFQDLSAAARPFVWPLATMLLMLALARADWSRLTGLLCRPALAVVLALANLIAVPLAAWPVWCMVGLEPGLVEALCLSAMAPGIIAAAATAAFLRLDSSLALLLTLLTNFLVPFTMPPLALWLLGLDLRIGPLALGLRLGSIVVVAAVGALAICRRLGPRLDEHRPTLDGLSVIVLMIFAVPLMDGVLARALGDPARFAGFVAAAFAGMLLCNLVMALASWPFVGRITALTAGYCAGGRHNALLMAVLPATVDADILLFIAAVQFPTYLMPTLLQPIYRRLVR